MKRKHFLRAFLLSLTVLLILQSSLTGCGKRLEETASGVTVKGREGVVYHHASVTYEPVETGKKYGTLHISSSIKLDVYRIKGLSPEEWLADEAGDVLYADGVTLPTLSGMEPSAVQVCTYQTSVYVLRRLSDADLISSLVTAYETAEDAPYLNAEPLRSFKLRFESEKYPALYFSVLYIEYDEDQIVGSVNYGRYFLYSMFDERFVPVDSRLHDVFGFEDGAETATGEAA